ncbi:hypothetical protein [Horticoccus sp. 23ND18S-11]|uniref:hypothetical protein n=1 Tax=Horticoccus sp. 23ND18S-11 TaxID=3391832 RepID=UPI0039C9A7DB
MVVIRRMVDRHRAYTAILLPGEPPKIFPSSDQEHARVLQIYKQDRAHEGICNDFSAFALGSDVFPGEPRRPATTHP